LSITTVRLGLQQVRITLFLRLLLVAVAVDQIKVGRVAAVQVGWFHCHHI
jgi:uncharacterized paraquat-inducible protein A